MAQHDMNIINADGATIRGDINDALGALVSNNAGLSAPPVTYANMWWPDLTNGLLKQRNAANSAWIIRGTLADAPVEARTSNTILGVADYGKTLIATGTWTQTLTAAATLGNGWWCEIRNDDTGAITLDPDGAELIDGVASIVLAPGESCKVVCDGGGLKTTGLSALRAQYRGALHGKCRLAMSGANLFLSRYDGLTIVDGADNILTVPAAGVSLSPAGTAAGALYLIYASDADADGVIDTLEWSATTYETAANGVKHKTAEPSKVLVGMASPETAGAWVDTASRRRVASYFNRRPIRAENYFSTFSSTSSPSYVDLNSTPEMISFVCFAQPVQLDCRSAVKASNNSATVLVAPKLDSTTYTKAGMSEQIVATGSSLYQSVGSGITFVDVTDGLHTADVMGATSVGTATFAPDVTGVGVIFQG